MVSNINCYPPYLLIHIPINPIIYPELTGFSNSKRKILYSSLYLYDAKKEYGRLSVVKLK